MCFVYLSLGSNQGERFSYLQQAVQLIEQRIGCIDKISSYYETEPWGYEDELMFINQVIKVGTDLSATKVLERSLMIEKVLGRQRLNTTQAYSGRTIDIDILLYDKLITNTQNLVIPHKFFHKRRFVLEPFCEIAPDIIHPILNKSIFQLLIECQDNLIVKKLNGKDILGSVA